MRGGCSLCQAQPSGRGAKEQLKSCITALLPKPQQQTQLALSHEEENVCCSIALSWGLALSASGAQRLHQDPGMLGGAGAAPQGPAHAALLHPQPLSSWLGHLAAVTASLLLVLGLSSLLVRGWEQGKWFGPGDGEWGGIASVFCVPGLQIAHVSLKTSFFFFSSMKTMKFDLQDQTSDGTVRLEGADGFFLQ